MLPSIIMAIKKRRQCLHQKLGSSSTQAFSIGEAFVANRKPVLVFFSILTFGVSVISLSAQTVPVTVTVTNDSNGAELPGRFLGLSYEASILLPSDGRYYFDPEDQALLRTFQTLGIKSLRIGANGVDDPHVAIPTEEDIDVLFRFARAAGVKVIYSFRLKNGNPANSARLASYIAAHYSDALDCFAIGNEPEIYLPTYPDYFVHWKLHYDAILRVVPQATFDGPSVGTTDSSYALYALDLAKSVSAEGHLAMASDHYYFFGSGREAEKDPEGTRGRFLSNNTHAIYQAAYNQIGAVLARENVPYRIDELNSCYFGGARGSSDTYASTLWALDCTHWWAAHDHHILGMNYHTGESAENDGGFTGPNYSAFIHTSDRRGFAMKPPAYAYLAFTQGAHGHPLLSKTVTRTPANISTYAYRDHDGSIYVTLINKSYGPQAQTVAVSLRLPQGTKWGAWRRMDLEGFQNVGAQKGITLGGSSIDQQGRWMGQWRTLAGVYSSNLTIQLSPASAAILNISAAL